VDWFLKTLTALVGMGVLLWAIDLAFDYVETLR
jgi:hypothetical protein